MSEQESFQARVKPWLIACFGEAITMDQVERRQRFLEEAIELGQSAGAPLSEVIQLMEYVYSRPAGELVQEIGGVMTTLAALSNAHGVDMHICGDVELARIWTKVEAIREKQRTKPKNSPLPQKHESTTRKFDADAWRANVWSAVREYGIAITNKNDEGEISSIDRFRRLAQQGAELIQDLQLQLSVAGTEMGAYYRGQDAAVAGVSHRWEEALTQPYPKAGVMNQPLEGLYRQTEELRRQRDLLAAFVTNLRDSSAGYMHNGNRLQGEAEAILKEIGAP